LGWELPCWLATKEHTRSEAGSERRQRSGNEPQKEPVAAEKTVSSAKVAGAQMAEIGMAQGTSNADAMPEPVCVRRACAKRSAAGRYTHRQPAKA